MPITKSAKKALRQSKKRRARNIQKKEIIKKLLKEMKRLVSSTSEKKVKEDKSSFPASLSQAIAKGEEKSLLSSPSRNESSAIEGAKKLLPQVYKLLDKAAKTGLIKKNTAARKKSRITKLINKSQQ